MIHIRFFIQSDGTGRQNAFILRPDKLTVKWANERGDRVWQRWTIQTFGNTANLYLKVMEKYMFSNESKKDD